MVRLTLCFAVLLAVFGNGLCIKCYQCASSFNKYKCQENLLNYTSAEINSNLKECNQDALTFNKNYLRSVLDPKMIDLVPTLGKFQCAKITTASGETARTCLPSETSSICQLLVDSKQLKSCSYCDKDSCNGTSAISASLPVALLALVMSYILYKQ
ncbi:hypothetical protein NE865_09265 [Phthorimaea operculella]|nr:hypothetical protein NE865_09265 [Phthorimaea operculella]